MLVGGETVCHEKAIAEAVIYSMIFEAWGTPAVSEYASFKSTTPEEPSHAAALLIFNSNSVQPDSLIATRGQVMSITDFEREYDYEYDAMQSNLEVATKEE